MMPQLPPCSLVLIPAPDSIADARNREGWSALFRIETA
jgi:hypothetical protein